MEAKKIIRITADDGAHTPEQDALLLELVEGGCLTGVSAFVPRFELVAATRLMCACRSIEWGLHLNLTDGQSCLSGAGRSSLTGQDGSYLGSAFTRLALTGRLKPDDLRQEIGHQLDRFLDLFGRMDHVDSHRHIHRFPVVAKALAQALEERKLKPRVRNPARKLLPTAAGRSSFGLYADYLRSDWKRAPGWLMKGRVKRLLKSTGVPMGDGLLTPWPSIAADASDAAKAWVQALGNCPDGDWEINLHPGWDASDRTLVVNKGFQSQWQSFKPIPTH